MDEDVRLTLFIVIVGLLTVVGLMFINSFGLQLPHVLILLGAILAGLVVVLETGNHLRDDLWMHALLAACFPLVLVFLGARTLGGTFGILVAICSALPALLTMFRRKVFARS